MKSMTRTRKSTYKLPPTTITDTLVSQESRRNKALEEQKRRRASKFESARHLDQFADLNLGLDGDEDDEDDDEVADVVLTVAAPTKKKKKKKSKKSKSRWADKCMYAELLEISSDDRNDDYNNNNDGLPADLETAWVAVGPVPRGKRCMAITQAPGSVPNTTIRSRLLGKVLLRKFPSTLPPLTILDCILDANWTRNGILHVLDVIRWKGHDLAPCDTSFRFWWRDTRLAELSHTPPPITTTPPLPIQPDQIQPHHYRFPYPNTFIPVPYHTNTTYYSLLSHVLPTTRAPRYISLDLPLTTPPTTVVAEETMDIDFSTGKTTAATTTTKVTSRMDSDGLLLYVKEASYEAGTSPLSSWVPLHRLSSSGEQQEPEPRGTEEGVSPLDLFERLVRNRVENGISEADQGMEVG